MKKIDKKPILIAIGLVLFQSICFLTCKLFGSNPHIIGSAIDKKIPFSTIAIIPYCIWYIMLFLMPYLLYTKDKNKLTKYCLSYMFVTIVAVIIFIIYPTEVIRPEVTGNNPLELLTRFIFWIDTPPINCFPSLHCAISMLWILFIFNIKDSTIYEKVTVTIISITIMFATLVIKQHVLIDLISGDVIATCIFMIFIYEKKLSNKLKKLLKI